MQPRLRPDLRRHPAADAAGADQRRAARLDAAAAGRCRQILANLEQSLDGAAQDVHIPLIGDTLDAGANVVGTFNDGVVVAARRPRRTADRAGDQDGDSDVDAYDLASSPASSSTTELGRRPAPTCSATRTAIPGDPNADGDIDDIVVTPLCGSPAERLRRRRRRHVELIRDFRVTFKLGQAIDGDVPFDIGLRGLPVRLTGGVHGSRLLEPPGRLRHSAEDGAYIVANGKAPLAGKTEKRPFDADTTEPPDGTNDGPHGPSRYLQDDDTDFNGDDSRVDLVGMWLQNTTIRGQGCRVTKVENAQALVRRLRHRRRRGGRLARHRRLRAARRATHPTRPAPAAPPS